MGGSLVPTHLCSPKDYLLVEAMCDLGLQQYSYVRNSNDNQLDLVFCNGDANIAVSRCDELVPKKTCSLHHFPLEVVVDVEVLHSIPSPCGDRYDFWHADFDRLNDFYALRLVNFSFDHADIVLELYETLEAGFKQFSFERECQEELSVMVQYQADYAGM